MRFPAKSAVLLSLFVALVMGASAQTSTTSVRGTVTDKSGAAIAGAKVTLSNPQRGFARSTTTSPTGVYEFLQLTPATYTLTVEAPGFRKSVQTNVELLVDTPATLNTTLQVGTISETIEVSAEGSIVNTTDASIGNAFNEHQVKELPLEGRNVPDLLTLQAGVTYTGNRSDIDSNVDTRSGAVNGAHSDQSNVTLDGTDSNDQVNGTAFNSVLPVTLDSVQEFRVTTSNYNADQGRSSGAQVSLVTKSGANAFHGSLYEYHRNTITSANDYFVKTAEVQNGQPNTPLKLIRNIFGASLGGPVLKNRLFFFANYEGYRQREEQSVLRMVPSDALRDGVMEYECQDPSLCPGGPVQGYTGSHNVPAGSFGLTPAQLAGMDPAGVGPNAIMIPYFNTFPHANDLTQGDGTNFVGYRFRGPTPINRNWYIARLDYKLNESGTHTIFWRGALRTDNKKDVPYLLGTPALQTFEDFSKGFTVGYTATLRPTLINNFHWGYTRQSYGDIGNNNTQPFIFFRGLNDDSTTNFSSLAVVRSRVFQAPVQNLVDDITWVKGKHTVQFGTNIRFIRNPRSNFLSSFPDGFTNSSALDTGGIVGQGSPLDPGNNGYPAVSDAFSVGYNYPVIAMMGLVTQLDAAYNFDKQGNQIPVGAPLNRRFGADEYEFYLQDSYKIKPNLTINYGVRWSLFSPPWETSGTEVAPNVSLGQWFKQRGANMLNGIGSEADPTISFDLAGAANNKKGYYSWDTHNFAPRLSFAYSPHTDGWLKHLFGGGDKTTIRAGAGMVYDRIGSGLLSSFDRFGAFGLSTQISNSVVPSADSAPRLTGLNTIPQNDRFGNPIFPPPPVGGFPYTPPPSGTGLGIYWGLDDSIKTPYSYTLDFSIGRELPKNMSLEVSYVGRMSHRLLAQEDLAMPLNLVDKKSGVSYFQAARRIAELYTANTPTSSVTPSLVGPTAAYWQNMITPLKPGDQYTLFCSGGATTSPLQAVYDIYSCFPTNDTTSLAVIDFYGSDFSGNAGIQGTSGTNYYPFAQGANTFFNSQFHSLYAWRSIGNANYNAMQVSLRKRMSHGVQFDFNYTYSKSIDLESDAERITPWSGLGGQIINSWSPNQNRAVSDFDTTHQINLNWIADLPVGRGKAFASTAHGFVDAVIGGWQLSGLARWTSGFPVNVGNGATWPTNWQLSGSATKIGPVVAGAFKQPDGSVNLFRDAGGPTGHGAFRNDFPGETGTRNSVRGPGFAGLDMGLSKSWKMPYAGSNRVQFRWEVFNVPNLKRFDVQSASTGLDAGDFGKYSGLLTNPRVMQFALRYEF